MLKHTQRPGPAISAPSARANGRAGWTGIAPKVHPGFTLIELVTVVAIVGIIAAVAYPSYVEYMNKARRSDATTSLMDAANRQEQFLLDHKVYAGDMKLLGYSENPYITPEEMYSIAAANTGCGITPCFELTATPISGKPQAKDKKCAKFIIDSTGEKTAVDTDDEDTDKCW